MSVEDRLKDQYSKLNSDESMKYVEQVMLFIGEELERKYPGVTFFLKARVKSEESYNEKIERAAKKKSLKEQQIYDGIGFCLIIEHIPRDFWCDDINDKKYEILKNNITERTKVKQRMLDRELKLHSEKTRFDLVFFDIQKQIDKLEEKVLSDEEKHIIYNEKIENLKRRISTLEGKDVDEEDKDVYNKKIISIKNQINEASVKKFSYYELQIISEQIDKLEELALEDEEKNAKYNERMENINKRLNNLDKIQLSEENQDVLESLKSNFYSQKQSRIEIINSVSENIKDLEKNHKWINNYCNRLLAGIILSDFTKDNSILQKKLGLTRIPNRYKPHKGGKTGFYIAEHDSLKSKILKYWLMEFIVMSNDDYRDSREGLSKHSDCEGKKRIVPLPRAVGKDPLKKIPKEEWEKFVEKSLKKIPKNLIYKMSGQSGKSGYVYVCSEVENFTYFYADSLKGVPQVFRYIIENTRLFSDKSKIVSNPSGNEDR